MSAKAKPEKLALHGGEPAKKTPFTSGPKHSLAEWEAIKPIFERGKINMTRGPEVMALREKFQKLLGMKYAVTTSSGTAALHTALGALEIGRGDEVITSPITDMGTLVAILAQNAVPVFADVDPLTLEITPETIEARITEHTRAILVVHLAGLPADMKGVMRLARRHKIKVVEDMAQSYLCKHGDRYCGTFGAFGCWSLNETKHIGAGDGGVLLTNNRRLARRADLFADKCYNREGGPTDPSFAPYNYRLNTLVAGVCLEQMKKLKGLVGKRHRHGARLDRELATIPGILPRPVRDGDYATYWYYVFLIDHGVLNCSNEQFAAALSAEGVWATPFTQNVMEWTLFRKHRTSPWACAQSCPLYKGSEPDYDTNNFPGMLQVRQRAVRTGINEFYSAQDIRDIARAVKKVASHYAKTSQ